MKWVKRKKKRNKEGEKRKKLYEIAKELKERKKEYGIKKRRKWKHVKEKDRKELYIYI